MVLIDFKKHACEKLLHKSKKHKPFQLENLYTVPFLWNFYPIKAGNPHPYKLVKYSLRKAYIHYFTINKSGEKQIKIRILNH